MIDKYAYAHNRIRKLARQLKKAELLNDAVGASASSLYTYPLAPLAAAGGYIHGIAADAPTVKDIKKMDNQPGTSFLPGVGFSRMLRREKALRSLLKDDPDSFDYPVSDAVGAWTHPIAYTLGGGLAGAGLGGIIGGGEGAAVGSLIGAGAGAATSGIGSLIGAYTGWGTKKRTLEQQAEAENKKYNLLLNTLVPGRAVYNRARRLNTSQLLSEMSEDDINKEVARIKKQRGVK